MNASMGLVLASAAFLGLSACGKSEGNTSAGKDDSLDITGYASGVLWVANKSESSLRKPAVITYDLRTGNKLRSVDLPRNPHEMLLTSKYAWVLCKDLVLVRVRRSDMAIDSVKLAQKSSTGPRWPRLAADDAMVWIGDQYEGLIRVDPEGLAEVSRMTFKDPDVQSVDGIAMAGGFPWILLGGNSFRLQKIDPEAKAIAATVGLGQDAANPKGPRVLGKRDWGAMGVYGERALIYAYEGQKLLRIDLAGARVESFWDADWIKWSSLGTGKDIFIRGYEGGFAVTASDALWLRRVGNGVQTFSQAQVKGYMTANAVRRDGLFAAGYTDGGLTESIGLFQESGDPLRGIDFVVDRVALAFE